MSALCMLEEESLDVPVEAEDERFKPIRPVLGP